MAEALPGLSLGVEGHRTVWNVAVRARTDNLDEENRKGVTGELGFSDCRSIKNQNTQEMSP